MTVGPAPSKPTTQVDRSPRQEVDRESQPTPVHSGLAGRTPPKGRIGRRVRRALRRRGFPACFPADTSVLIRSVTAA